MHIFKVFKVKKEERWLALVMLVVFITFNVLVIASHYHVYTMGAHGGFWSIFTKNFRISGYDNWSWITISGMRIHFETIRHPLYLTFLYPLYLLDNWLIHTVEYNFAVYFMAAIIVFSALYAVLFMYRILREVLELKRFDATLLTVLLFSFGHVLVPTMVPDHFIISMMLLTMTLYHRNEDEERTPAHSMAIVYPYFLHSRHGNVQRSEDATGRAIHKREKVLHMEIYLLWNHTPDPTAAGHPTVTILSTGSTTEDCHTQY